jgi:hypothetical protein
MTAQPAPATVVLKGVPKGELPYPGDFVYNPQYGNVGVVFHTNTPAADQLSSSGEPDLPSWAIGTNLELHALVNTGMVLPVREGAYVITAGAVRRFVNYFFANYVLTLPQVATNPLFRQHIVNFLEGGNRYYARTYFDFDDERDQQEGGHDPELHAKLRELFEAAFRVYAQTPNAELKAAQYTVFYTVLFSAEPRRD